MAAVPSARHRRNQNYSDILRSLALGDKRLSAFDLTLRFTHLFWFGDLNYRVDMDVQVCVCGQLGSGCWDQCSPLLLYLLRTS